MAGFSECIICYSPLNSTDSYVITKCGHVFHGECIKPWIKNSASCPNCRVRARENNLVKLYLNEGETDFKMEAKYRRLDDIIAKTEANCHRLNKIIAQTESKYLKSSEAVALILSGYLFGLTLCYLTMKK